MTLYIISFAINMLLGLSLCIKKNGYFNGNELNVNLKKRGLYLFITALQLGLICGFRSSVMAYDTNAYKELFDMASNGWQHLFDKNSYVEIGFQVLCGLIKICGGEYQTLLVITSLFTMGSCCLFIYRHSKDVVLSVFIIISFPFFYSSFDIIRHFLATSFLLLGYKHVVERRPIRFLIYIAIGSLFHKIAWLFVPLYFVRKIKWSWIVAFVSLGITMALYIYIRPIGLWLSDFLDKSSGVDSGWIDSYGGGLKTALMYGVIFLLSIVAFYQTKGKTEDDMNALIHVMLMFLFSILFINARIMTRMIMTMSAFIAIAIPQLLDRKRTMQERDCVVLRFGFIGIGFVYHTFMLTSNWQNVVPYIPFWR